MQQCLANILARRPGIGRGADMHGHLLVLSESGKQGDGDDRPLPLRPAGTRPDMPPCRLGDQLLERTVEIGRCRRRPVDVIVA